MAEKQFDRRFRKFLRRIRDAQNEIAGEINAGDKWISVRAGFELAGLRLRRRDGKRVKQIVTNTENASNMGVVAGIPAALRI